MGLVNMIRSILSTKEQNKSEYNKDKEIITKPEVIYSPLEGEVIKLEKVNDPTFAKGIMGKGIAVFPNKGQVVSPVNGQVVAIFNTKHAIALKSDNGAEILIHIGIDTVNLNGKYFLQKVKQGERVSIGDLLVEFDINNIKKEGYDLVTSVIITNTDMYLDIKETEVEVIREKDNLLELTL